MSANSHVIGPLVVGGRVLGAIPWWVGWRRQDDVWAYVPRGAPGQRNVADRQPQSRHGRRDNDDQPPLAKSGPDTTQTNTGAFLLHEWTPVQPLTISAGGRYDWFNTTTALF